MWYMLSIAGLTLAVIAIWPFSMERRKTVIGIDERHGAEGDFARLSQGVTHYRWLGPARGPVAVVIHGLASPMESMEPIAEGLGRREEQLSHLESKLDRAEAELGLDLDANVSEVGLAALFNIVEEDFIFPLFSQSLDSFSASFFDEFRHRFPDVSFP